MVTNMNSLRGTWLGCARGTDASIAIQRTEEDLGKARADYDGETLALYGERGDSRMNFRGLSLGEKANLYAGTRMLNRES